MAGEWETVSKPSGGGGEWETVSSPSMPAQPAARPAGIAPLSVPDVVSANIADPTKQTAFETQLQGTSAGINATMSSIFDPVAAFVSENTPDEIKDYLARSAEDFLQLPNVQSSVAIMQEGGDAWDKFESDYPRMAMNIKAATNIATIGAGGMAFRGSMKSKAVENTIKPYLNQRNINEMIDDGRLVAGGLTKGKFVMTPKAKRQADALKSVPGFGPGQTALRRVGLINAEIAASGNRVDNALLALGRKPAGKIPASDIKGGINSLSDRMVKRYDLDVDEVLRPSEQRKIRRRLLTRLYGTGSQDTPVSVYKIHKVRQAIDAKYKEVKGDRFVQGLNKPSREEMMYRAERDMLNDLVDKASPDTREARSRIAALFEVRDVVQQKAVKGNQSFREDIKGALPFGGDGVRIKPGGGR